MAININHSIGKLKSDDDLKLDAGVGKNIDVSSKIVKNASDPVDPQDLVTKAFLDATLATFDNTTDAELTADLTEVYETIENVRNNTYVKSVDFVSNITSGGAGLTATLNITSEGNPNRYTIAWGDGDVTTGTTDSTPTHTYDDSSGSPFDVQVTAFHNQGVGAGSSQSKTREDYISIFTANPVVSFVAYDSLTGGSQITTWNDGDTVYFQNTTTNTAGATVQFTWNWGDGSADDVINDNSLPGGSAGPRITHTFAASTETDVTRTVSLTLDAHDTMTQSLLPLNGTNSFNIFDTHTPDTTSDITTGINEEASNGLDVTFTNNTESTIGSYTDFGITYRWDFGDGTIQTVNVGSGQSGDTGSTITHKYTLSDNSIAEDFTGNLQVISGHSSSPFTSSSFTIHVEPDVRANISGTAVHTSDRSGDNQFDVYDGFDYLGNNRAIVRVTDNSQNKDGAEFNWNDGSPNDTTTTETFVEHDYSGKAPGNYQLDYTASGTPDITAQTDTENLIFQVNAIPTAPDGLGNKTISLVDPAQGIDPKLAHGFTDNSASSPLTAGDELDTNTARRYTSGTLDTTIAENAFDGLTGTVTAMVNGGPSGSKTFSTSLNETGTFGDLVISQQADAHDTISSSTYPTGFYQTFDSKISKPFAEYSIGVNDQRIEHSTTGETNYVTVMCDDLTDVPTLDDTGSILSESVAGNYRYISGIPYYNTGNPKLTLSGLSVTNWIGQAYRDTNQVLEFSNGTNSEGTSGATIQTQFADYADLEDATYLVSGVPTANTLSYNFADQTIDITQSNIAAVETIKARIKNVNGTSAYKEFSTKVQVHRSNPTGIIEDSIPVSGSLGNGYINDNAIRIADFVADNTDNPTIVGATDYTATPFTGAVGVSGTQEATVRWGTLKHDTTDYSTGYLPVGPDRSADTGTQYFTLAFRRQVVANFSITINTTGISGLWIAAPGTAIDSASGLNGWLDCTAQYAGVGVPGSNTASGGNGGNGCALTGADVVPTNTGVNSTYTMTLGSENMSNATNNVVLVRVALEAGKQITNLQIGESS